MFTYNPTQIPTSAEALPAYLATELQALAQALRNSEPFAMVQQVKAQPSKPRDGMIVLTDAAVWNPGAGSGFYGYRGGAWRLLG